MENNRLRYFSFIFVLFLLNFGCDNQIVEESTAQKPDLTFRFVTVNTPSNRGWEAARLIKENLERQSHGRIEVLFYDSGVLGAERQLLETCYFGVTEMVLCTSSVVTTIDPTFSILDLPYLFFDDSHQQAVIQGPIGRELLDGLTKYKLQGLAFYALGMRHIFNAKGRAIHSPDDLAGLKIRVMESPVMIDSLNAMGASATPLSHSELFQALKTGVVDGAENNPMQYVASKYFEADCRNYSLTGHFANQTVLAVNRDWLEKVRREHPDLYDLIRRVPLEIAAEYNRLWEEGIAQSYQRMKAEDVAINSVDDVSAFLKRVQPVYDAFFAKHPDVPRSLVDRIRQQVKGGKP